MMKDLQWSTLHECSRLIIFYIKTHQTLASQNITNITLCMFTSPSAINSTYSITSNYHQKSSFPHTINDWNNLPSEKIECSTLDEFSYHLKFCDHILLAVTRTKQMFCMCVKLLGAMQLHLLCCISLAVLHSNKSKSK